MEAEEKHETERLKQDPRIKRALESSTKKRDRTEEVIEKKDKQVIGLYLIVLLAVGFIYFLFESEALYLKGRYEFLIGKAIRILLAVVIVTMINRIIKAILYKKIDNAPTRYNLKRITNLATTILLSFIILTLLFTNWYATVVSLGLISLILGLALQNPITSFFAWIYILVRKPYEVGDRIRIGHATGDVIGLGYLDTTLWEFGGEYISGDHPSGRVIRFANSKIFSEFVFNYSWPLFPYMWNEIKLFVAYESDLSFVHETIKSIAEKELGEDMMRRVKIYRNVLGETPVDELEVRERPSVTFRAHDNTWIEVVVRYLVQPKEAGRVKNRLFNSILSKLNEYPEKALFPKTNMR
ncbi:MAG: mechanosensitive ion channel family protein [Cyclobacteriaceae bacterium]